MGGIFRTSFRTSFLPLLVSGIFFIINARFPTPASRRMEVRLELLKQEGSLHPLSRMYLRLRFHSSVLSPPAAEPWSVAP